MSNLDRICGFERSGPGERLVPDQSAVVKDGVVKSAGFRCLSLLVPVPPSGALVPGLCANEQRLEDDVCP